MDKSGSLSGNVLTIRDISGNVVPATLRQGAKKGFCSQHHAVFIGDLIGNREHGFHAAPMDPERGPQPKGNLPNMTCHSIFGSRIHQVLYGNSGRSPRKEVILKPKFSHAIDNFRGDGANGFNLEGIADRKNSFCPPDRADSCLRQRLSGFVDEHPAEALRF